MGKRKQLEAKNKMVKVSVRMHFLPSGVTKSHKYNGTSNITLCGPATPVPH
jgi:hypothetical protein